jgi:predicted RNA methylase
MGASLDTATLAVVTPETVAAIARLEASGLIAEGLAAFRADYVYAVEIAHDHAEMTRKSERLRERWAARSARAQTHRERGPRTAGSVGGAC